MRMRLVVQAWLTSRMLTARTVEAVQAGLGVGLASGFGVTFFAGALVVGSGLGAGGGATALTGALGLGFSSVGVGVGFSAT